LTPVNAPQVEVAFFLAHWNEIKGSPAMANIWQHIRLGRHLGFEEGERDDHESASERRQLIPHPLPCSSVAFHRVEPRVSCFQG
jgi:hypothetical protein